MGTGKQLEKKGMAWPPLTRGRLIKRYKRFLADVALGTGETVTAHCSNSGRMTGCNQPGQPVYLSFHDNPKRKLKYTWEIIEMPTSWVGVNTLVPNRLVAKAAANGAIPELSPYTQVRREVKINDHSRLDLKLTEPGMPDCFIEIKNCTLVENRCAKFPDAPTTRGQKHLKDLAELKAAGARAVIFFLIQRTDAEYFSPADNIDPQYGRLLRQVVKEGVEILAYDVTMTVDGICLRNALPYKL